MQLNGTLAFGIFGARAILIFALAAPVNYGLSANKGDVLVILISLLP